MILQIVFSLLAVSILGLILGVGLAFAARVLAVKKDERVTPIETALPGLNCGTCGYAGCAAYAAAIVGGDVALDLCRPGGDVTLEGISKVMGVEFTASGERRVTQVHCRGGCKTAVYKFDYAGLHDCNAAYAMFEGFKQCRFGCLGEGSCIAVCPVEAIGRDSEGLVWVDKYKCVACGLCVDVCPTGVMQWVPNNADYIVACNSTDKGAAVRKYCSVGCIACKLCERKSPEGGYKVDNFLARIDYTATGERTNGAKACPTGCIIKNQTTAELGIEEREERESAAASPAKASKKKEPQKVT